MKRIIYLVTFDGADPDELAAAEAELLDTVTDISSRYAVKAEAAYDRTVEITCSKGADVDRAQMHLPFSEWGHAIERAE